MHRDARIHVHESLSKTGPLHDCTCTCTWLRIIQNFLPSRSYSFFTVSIWEDPNLIECLEVLAQWRHRHFRLSLASTPSLLDWRIHVASHCYICVSSTLFFRHYPTPKFIHDKYRTKPTQSLRFASVIKLRYLYFASCPQDMSRVLLPNNTSRDLKKPKSRGIIKHRYLFSTLLRRHSCVIPTFISFRLINSNWSPFQTSKYYDRFNESQASWNRPKKM